MRAFKVISDSGAGLPSHLLYRYGIEIVPLQVIVGKESYSDNQLTLADFLDLQENSGQKITTSAPSPQVFLENFEQAKKEGFKEILVVTLSSKVSGTYSSAQIAAENFSKEIRIRIVDSQSAAMGQGILVLKAAKAGEEGKSLEEVADWLEKEREKIQVWAFLDTLKYALAGGRIPREEFEKIATFLGGMASRVFKVMVTLKEGRPSLAGIQFLFKGAISSLTKKVEQAKRLGLEYLSLMHIANPVGVRLLLNGLAKFYPKEEIIIADISTVLAAHSGRGTIGLAFSTRERG